MKILLDTCALIWLTIDPSELSPKAHKTLANAQEILISSISVWEIGVKYRRKRIDLGMDFLEYAGRIESSSDLTIIPVDLSLWAQTALLHWEHKDPADRVIVCTAQAHSATIITDDKVMAKFYPKTQPCC